jgi:anthranilate/para-aminobenzoate synthase component II
VNVPLDTLRPKTGSTTTRRHGFDDAYPQLNLKVLIVGNCFLSGAIELFAKAGCRAASSMEDCDLVVFLGGEDVDPQLYGEKPINGTYINAKRDEAEIDVFTKALQLGKPMFGICRGMQFLHVMNGGKLYQDVRNHGMTHWIRDNNGDCYRASSMHHQMCIEDDDTFALAYAVDRDQHGRISDTAWSCTYVTPAKTITDARHLDLEAAVWSNIDALGVQGHPEVGGYPEYSAWCMQQIKEYLEERRLMGSNSKPGQAYINPDVVPPSINPGVDV